MDEPRRVRLTSRKGEKSGAEELVVLVDGEPLKAVTRISIDYEYTQFIPRVHLQLIGVDIDLEAMPEYMVKVAGPLVHFPKQRAEVSGESTNDGV